MKTINHILVLASLPVLLASCGTSSGSGIRLNRESVRAGRVCRGDSATAVFRLVNPTSDTVRVSVMPECDCTSVSEGHPLLPPHSRTRIVARIAADSPGEFVKYVFVQPDDSEFFITLKITGNVR